MLDWLRRAPKFSLVGGCAAGLVLLLAVFTITRLQDLGRHNCGQIETVKAEIRLVVAQGLKMLGQPGTGGYRYYLAHPDELRQTRQTLRHEIVQFAPSRCS